MAEQLFEDDGTLACLHIPADESNKRFACKAERQENLIGKTFWLLDFLGYVFRHGYVLLRKRIKRNLFRALAHQRKVARNCKQIRLAVGSYIGWLKYTNSKHLTNTLNNFCYGKVF